MSKKHKVFVYGTLRALTGEAEATHSLANYAMFDAGQFPFIEKKVGSIVYGNMMEVNNKELRELDIYEGVSKNLYTREEVEAFDLKALKLVRCFVYVGTDVFRPHHITSGDWFSHTRG